MKEAAGWSVAYIAMAVVFGGIVWAVWGHVYGAEYFGGYINSARFKQRMTQSSYRRRRRLRRLGDAVRVG